MTAVELRGVDLGFGERHVLESLDLTVDKGDFVCLLGPSGCGKSSLLRLIAGLQQPSRGEVRRAPGPVSFVFQDARLLPWRTVRENVLLPFDITGRSARDPEEVLRRVNLWEVRDLFPHQLSGGMKQRAAIARALITEPELLLLDEPFSALDEMIRNDLEDLLRDLWRKRRMTVVFVTHSLAESVYLGERILLMSRVGGKFLVDRRTDLGERTADSRTHSDFNAIVRDLSQALHAGGRA